MQQGFDQGFKLGSTLGQQLGRLFGQVSSLVLKCESGQDSRLSLAADAKSLLHDIQNDTMLSRAFKGDRLMDDISGALLDGSSTEKVLEMTVFAQFQQRIQHYKDRAGDIERRLSESN